MIHYSLSYICFSFILVKKVQTKLNPNLNIDQRLKTEFNSILKSNKNENRTFCSPVIEHRRRRVGAFPEYWLIIPWLWARGVGMLRVIALWNLRRLGSTVTTGDTATPRPNSLAVKSGSIGCAWKIMLSKI